MTGRTKMETVKGLMNIVGPLSWHIVLSVIMGVLANVATVTMMTFGMMAVMNIVGYSTPLELEYIFIGLGASVLIRSLFVYVQKDRETHVSLTAMSIMRNRVFGALRRLCPAKLERHDKGDLINLITSDMESLESFYSGTVPPIMIAVIFCTIMTLFISSMNIILGILALSSYIAMGLLIPLVFSRICTEDGERFRKGSGELSSYLLDNLRGIREVQQYGYGESRLSGIGVRSKRLAKTEDRLRTLEGYNRSISGSSIMICNVAMILAAVLLFRDGTIDFYVMTMSIVAMMGSLGPCAALSELGTTLKTSLASGDRILDILEEEPLTEDITDKPPMVFDGVGVKNVTFSYDGVKVLKGASMNVEKGSVVGIMGPSGCGKSTLLKLMMRFWTPDDGKIKFSTRDIDYINTTDLRDIEGYVTQDTQILHDTIKNNILVAKVDATDDEVIDACKKASLHDFIMSLPDGYDTEVGELGDTLSAGEVQRIGLARAFLHDSQLLLLDEPTSNLDALNEASILKALDETREGRTTIIVSHTESTLRTADRIVRMDDGTILP